MRKYLVYATVEVLLVMIGILLAFQVNDWDNDRKDRLAELTTYANIRDQINDDKERIDGQIQYNDHFLSMFRLASQIIENKDLTQKDTLGKIAFSLTNYSDFDRKGNIYETLINSGQIKLLENQQIVSKIKDLEEHYLYINRIENIHYDAMIQYAVPGISRTVKFSTGEIMDTNGIYGFEFQNLIHSLISIMEEKDHTYRNGLLKIDETVALINKEVEEE